MRGPPPPLNALRAFEATARHLRFSKAAPKTSAEHPIGRRNERPVVPSHLLVARRKAQAALSLTVLVRSH
jgi:hypothetical protein